MSNLEQNTDVTQWDKSCHAIYRYTPHRDDFVAVILVSKRGKEHKYIAKVFPLAFAIYVTFKGLFRH